MPDRPWRLGRRWDAHGGSMVTIVEVGTGPADEHGHRDGDRLIGALARADAERVVAAVNHRHDVGVGDTALRRAVNAAASIGDPQALIVRLSSALREIVNTLGPDQVCACPPRDECGLHEEAAEALRIARDALRDHTAASSSCPTPCDEDCDARCHETHRPHWMRAHLPDRCPSTIPTTEGAISG